MSFNGFKSKVEEGEDVVLYLTINQIYTIKAEVKTKNKNGVPIEKVFQTPYGALKCGELIGKYYGSKISLSRGWGYILQPTPELWTLTLPHRTQIIYTPDISMIILQLELQPGSVVIESGTGSGSLSHALIRAIKPHGYLHTFDFHEKRVTTAVEEFKSHGFEQYVTVRQRDVCSEGFGDALLEKADAVFLDLPDPWLVVPQSVKCFKDIGGRICSFSPCIEQVQRTCQSLSAAGFQEIQTMEVLQNQYSVQTRTVPVMNLKYLRHQKDGDESKQEKETLKVTTLVPPVTQPGHTGYLTFATMPPLWCRQLQIELNQEQSDVI